MSPLEQMQADAYGRLLADPYFADIGVYLFRPRKEEAATQIIGNIEQALNCLKLKAGKGGAAVSVLMPTADTDSDSISTLRLRCSLAVRVFELPLTNMGATGTGKSAEEIAFEVLRVMHHYNDGANNVLAPATNVLTPSLEFAPKLAYDVLFDRFAACNFGLKVVTPEIEPEGGAVGDLVTLSCLTASAAIYYTTDGSWPSSVNPAATLYAEPFTIETACTLRVAAELPGYTQSNGQSATFV